MRLDAAARLWSRVIVHGPDDCHEWAGHTMKRHGYGTIGYHGKSILTHRFAWFLVYGRWPDGNLLHTCDNPKCVNVRHLREGTQAENVADMVAKGRRRGPKGEAVHTAKINYEIADLIREEWASGNTTYRALRDKYSLNMATIWAIITYRSWVREQPQPEPA